jgi:tetratricopeptide (TPR) repeat protein
VKALAFLLILGSVASAREDPEDLARAHAGKGRAYFAADDAKRALAEFLEAQRIAPRPLYDYEIGRCYEKLERWADAVGEYELYVSAEPTPSDAGYVRERIRVLRERINGPPRAPDKIVERPVAVEKPVVEKPAPSPHRRKVGLIVGLTVGAVVIAGVAVGLAVGLSGPSYTPVDFGPIRSTR